MISRTDPMIRLTLKLAFSYIVVTTMRRKVTQKTSIIEILVPHKYEVTVSVLTPSWL